MITFLKGQLIESLPGTVVIDVAGVGYEVLVPLSTLERLPAAPCPITLLTILHVREDAHVLYGFLTPQERDLYRLLVNHVSGIGPKLALAVLSGTSPQQFQTLVASSDIASLAKLKGIGKKTAERIVVELRDKVGVTGAWSTPTALKPLSVEGQKRNDLLLALAALGYKPADAQQAADLIIAKSPEAPLDQWIRDSLRQLNTLSK